MTTRVRSSTLHGRMVVGRTVVRSYGRTSKFSRRDGLPIYCINERHYQYNINQISDEDKEKYQFWDNKFINRLIINNKFSELTLKELYG